MPSPLATFEGIQAGLYVPPDPNGDVGLSHFVESVNTDLAVYDKTGNLAPGSPFPANELFVGFGGPCEDTNDGDGIIQYDGLADRWVFTQFALPNYPNPPFSQCFAVSQTGDPLGGWYRYEFVTPGQAFNDYPKLAVWPDAYYMTSNQFGPHSFIGSGAFAFDRAAMLAGSSATMVYFQLSKPNYGMLAADVENASSPPPLGEPEHIIGVNRRDSLRQYDFHVDFATPTNSTLTVPRMLPVDPFVWNPCVNPYSCIPQKGTSNRLDPLTGILLYQLEYFNYGAHEDMVVSHTIKAGNSSGIRWYQLRSTAGGPWSVYQQGTHAPDGKFRWLPSGALDADGNYAVGFNASSKRAFPSIRYAGRLESDPLGELAQGEAIMISGGGSQTDGYGRWGDYSSMQIDPSDGCTFWYTGQYYPTSSRQFWHTRVGTFAFPSCT